MKENTRKVLILQGIPGSGKTTWAKEFIKGKSDWVRVNRDDLRNMRGDYWIPNQEKFITRLEDSFLFHASECGLNIISDNANLNPKTLAKFEEWVRVHNNNVRFEGYGYFYEIEYKLFNTPLDVCIERDKNRERTVGEKVIRRFYNDYIDK